MYGSTQIQIHGADPACPHCGRPVIGEFVQGNAGRYHPECVRSPYAEQYKYTPFYPPLVPSQPYQPHQIDPFQPIITCEGN